MMKAFRAVWEPALTPRRFLKFAMVAGMMPALTAKVYAARDLDQGVRRFIERDAISPHDPWALVHAIRGVGWSCHIEGESTESYVLHTCVRAQEVHA